MCMRLYVSVGIHYCNEYEETYNIINIHICKFMHISQLKFKHLNVNMYAYVCVCACTYVRTYVCMYVFMHV